MAVFIEISTDAFEENQKRLRDKYNSGDRAGLSNVRRPLRGLEKKEDTYAMIKVIRADGKELNLVDSSDPTGRRTKTASFLLQSVQEARMEKHQIVETFGEPYIFFFGEAPRFLDVTALLINSLDFNWEAEWWANWEQRFRGTRTVELGARTYLFYDDNIVEGYMLMAQASKMSDQPFVVSLNWRMFVTAIKNITFIGDPNFPIRSSVDIPANISLTDADAFTKLVNSFRTEARAQEELAVYDDEVNLAAAQEFGGFRRLSNALRVGSRSIAFAADVQQLIDNLQNDPSIQDLPLLEEGVRRIPIRGKIADNTDEFTGSSTISPDFRDGLLPEVREPRIRTALEVQDLFQQAIAYLNCFGANVDSYETLQKMGMGVNFGAGSGGFGFGASAGASFSPQASSQSVGLGAGFGGGAGAGFGANGFSQVGSSASDPFFGGAIGASVEGNAFSGLNTDFGDRTYGYPSDYGGPGFGQSGYGDYGGQGFGSAFGQTGDPGYLPPDRFTWAGVDDDRSAFERFNRPPAGFGSGFGGVSAGSSYAATGVGASISVGGSITAFSLTTVPGNLDPSGCSNPGNNVNLLDLI